MVPTVNDGCVEWAAAQAAARGCCDSGDAYCVRAFDHRTMVAALDGLGHGPAAATVAKQSVRLLENARTPDISAIVRECHADLRGSRGVVMSLAMFDGARNTMEWLGVGNVYGTLWSPRSSLRRTLVLRGGLVGDVLPRLQASVVPVSEGDTLVFTTDGVTADIDDRLLQGASVHGIAERILTHRHTGHDDALALVVRYRGVKG
jgi:negative regulator of sigma-B (phosphoserine phosphatase)